MIFRLLKKHFLQNKIIFLFFIFSQIASLIVTLFIFNLLDIRAKQANALNSEYRTAQIYFEDIGERPQVIPSILKSDIITDIEGINTFVEYESMLIDVCIYSQKELLTVTEAGRFFSIEEINNHALVAVVNPKLKINGSFLHVGDTMEILGKEHEIIGLSSGVKYIAIPSNDSINSNLSFFEVVHKNGLGKSKTTALLDKMRYLFPDATIEAPKGKPSEPFSVSSEDILILLSLIIVNINFVALYCYIINNDSTTYSIFKICGCSSKRALGLLFGEAMIICASAFATASVIFSLIAAPIFAYMNSALQYKFSLEATFRALISYGVCVLILFTVILNRCNKKSTFQLYSKGEVL